MEIGICRSSLKTILHLDMNSYFATAEQQANPCLRGRPVGIIKAPGRGCVIASSIEAKKFGVKTGATAWRAKELCPEIILVPADMDKYFSLTKKMITIVENYSPTVEVFSIDEVFADVTETQNLFSGGVVEMVYRIKEDIFLDLGEWIKCSAGVSFSKLIAKLASEMNKPNGLTFLNTDNYLQETADIGVEKVCGIGSSRMKYLHDRGLFTLGMARKVDLPLEIHDLVWLLEDENLVTKDDLFPAKSVSRTYTTFEDLRSEKEVEVLIRNLSEEVAEKLREMGMAGRTLGLFVRSEIGSKSVRKTLKDPTNDGMVIFEMLWREYLTNSLLPVRFAGVSVSNLVWEGQMFILEEVRKRNMVLKSVDKVNDKWGQFTIYPAIFLENELIRPEVTGFLGDKWYRFGGRKRT